MHLCGTVGLTNWLTNWWTEVNHRDASASNKFFPFQRKVKYWNSSEPIWIRKLLDKIYLIFTFFIHGVAFSHWRRSRRMVFTKSALSNFKTSPNLMFPILENQTLTYFDIVLINCFHFKLHAMFLFSLEIYITEEDCDPNILFVLSYML